MSIRLIGRILFGFTALCGLLADVSLAAEQHFTLSLQNGRLAEVPPTLRAVEGDEVVWELTSDRSLELHLHGYDLRHSIAAGTTAVWRFAAIHSGRFPLEVHEHGGNGHGLLLYLEVYPE
jgi:hypothetical protein